MFKKQRAYTLIRVLRNQLLSCDSRDSQDMLLNNIQLTVDCLNTLEKLLIPKNTKKFTFNIFDGLKEVQNA